jgi:ankyrin repeat protein
LCNARLPHGGGWIDNSIAIAQLLLDRGADPNVYYQGGHPSIHYTALTCSVGRGEEQAPVHPRVRELAALLLERGADPYDMQFMYNAFAGHASQRHLAADDFVWLLDLIYAHAIRRGRERDWQDPDWSMLSMGGYGCGAWYMLYIALNANNLRLAEWALSHGANPNAPHPTHPRQPKGTLYEQAMQRGHLAFVELLVRYGATPSAAPDDDRARFIDACFRLDRSRVQALMAEHPEYAESAQVPLLAANRDRADVLALLFDLGVSPDLADANRRTLLHAAAYAGAASVVRLLIDRGARIDPVDTEHGTTPIYWAFWGQQPRTLDLLAPRSRDAWALVCAGKIDRLRELIAAEPDLAKMRDNVDTILFYLPDDEQVAAEIVRLLLANGADPTVKRRDGATAERIARARGLDDAADLLKGVDKKQKH